MAVRSRVATAATRRDVRLLGAVVAVELAVLSVYLLTTSDLITRPRYTLYPFVWINASLWAVLETTSPRAAWRHRAVAAGIASLYLVGLLWLAGLVDVSLAGYPAEIVGFTVGFGSPGWERISLVLPNVQFTVIPFRVVGYLALSYLVYVTVLDAAGATVSGALGLFSCVGCAFPVFVSLSSGAFGGSSAVVGALFAYSTDLSTVVFLLALALLYYRPTVEGTAGQRME